SIYSPHWHHFLKIGRPPLGTNYSARRQGSLFSIRPNANRPRTLRDFSFLSSFIPLKNFPLEYFFIHSVHHWLCCNMRFFSINVKINKLSNLQKVVLFYL